MLHGQGRTGGPGPGAARPVARAMRIADKRRAWRLAMLREEIRAVLRHAATEAHIQAVADKLLSLAA